MQFKSLEALNFKSKIKKMEDNTQVFYIIKSDMQGKSELLLENREVKQTKPRNCTIETWCQYLIMISELGFFYKKNLDIIAS